MPSDYNALRKLNDLIRGIRIAMLTTIRGDGLPHSRPMATQQAESDGELWFFTGWSTKKTHEVEENPLVNLGYANPDGNTYISVSGAAALLRDPDKARELWSPAYKAWFPKGLDDPDLALLRVTVQHVEYWDAPSGAMVQLAGLVKNAVSGKRYRGDHGEMELHGARHD
jgi:general stress protein 26